METGIHGFSGNGGGLPWTPVPPPLCPLWPDFFNGLQLLQREASLMSMRAILICGNKDKYLEFS